MNTNWRDHLIDSKSTVKEALIKLDLLAANAIVFAIDGLDVLQGSLTDGDIRRALINDLSLESGVSSIVNSNPKSLVKGAYSLNDVIELREKGFDIVPVVDSEKKVVNVINLRQLKSYLPLDAVIMAGGRGSRLRPLTDTIPKPLLKVGDKPIIEHNLDRLRAFGVDDFWISVRYLGEQIEEFFGDGSPKGISVDYIWENDPLGTIGAVTKIKNFKHDHVLVTNSDILTNLDYEAFYMDFIERDADISVVTIPYKVNVPYAVLETSDNQVISFKEKPDYTYYSNGGIYLIKREILELIPEETFYNSTDLMQEILDRGGKLVSYPMRQYWLDVGKPKDFEQAQNDIKYLLNE